MQRPFSFADTSKPVKIFFQSFEKKGVNYILKEKENSTAHFKWKFFFFYSLKKNAFVTDSSNGLFHFPQG